MTIDFTMSEDQLALRSAARTFATERLSLVDKAIADLPTPEARFAAIRPFYQEMADAGFVKALLPVHYGGTAMSSLDFALAAEELTRVDINVPTALLGTGLGLQPIIHFGTEEQRAKFLPRFAGTEALLAAWAFTEVTGGANSDSATTTTRCCRAQGWPAFDQARQGARQRPDIRLACSRGGAERPG